MRIEHIDCGLAVGGEFDASAVEPFDIALQEALLESDGAFVLDFSGLTFMDSGGVNSLLRARALLGREERSLALICPPGPPRRVIDLIGVDDLFTIFATRDDAIKALVPLD
jgi:anti-sigma B factor antagonist